jgi:hypothetical protein
VFSVNILNYEIHVCILDVYKDQNIIEYKFDMLTTANDILVMFDNQLCARLNDNTVHKIIDCKNVIQICV